MRRIQRLTLLLVAVVAIGLTGCAESVTGPAPLGEPPAVQMNKKKSRIQPLEPIAADSTSTSPLEPVDDLLEAQRLLTRY